jgi:hypothetical protein
MNDHLVFHCAILTCVVASVVLLWFRSTRRSFCSVLVWLVVCFTRKRLRDLDSTPGDDAAAKAVMRAAMREHQASVSAAAAARKSAREAAHAAYDRRLKQRVLGRMCRHIQGELQVRLGSFFVRWVAATATLKEEQEGEDEEDGDDFFGAALNGLDDKEKSDGDDDGTSSSDSESLSTDASTMTEVSH